MSNKEEINKLLSILDGSEENQTMYLAATGIINFAKGDKGEAYLIEPLIKTAFRLRNELHYVIGAMAWDKACWEVWKHVMIQQDSNVFERKHLSLDVREKYCYSWMSFWAKPIHWIIAALMAKEMAREDKDEKV